jgi:peptidoglycan/xylan/chitin deacetylase (PgdA/CDA1 family)
MSMTRECRKGVRLTRARLLATGSGMLGGALIAACGGQSGARLPGLTTARLAGRWFRGFRARLLGGALILGYHRVAETLDDPYKLCVAPQHLSEHLQVLRRVAHPISLRALEHGLQTGQLPKRAVAVTFDDGYADLLDSAKPLLERHDVPATAFVVSGNLGRTFWWDEMAQSLQVGSNAPRTVNLTLDGKSHQWVLDTAPGEANTRQRVIDAIHRELLPLPASTRREALRQLESQAPGSPDRAQLPRALTPDEVIELADGGLIEIGSHTVTHPALASLSVDDQRFEIHQSKTSLEQVVDRPVRSFSYPHGSVTPRTVGTVREGGFELACSSFNDVARPATDPFQLPRLWVQDVDGEAFSRWLHIWLPR